LPPASTTPSTTSAPAFVAGATGYTGREVVRVLRERGVSTFAHVRPDSSRIAEWTARFAEVGAQVDTTPWDGPALAETLRRVQPGLVFALLGTTRERGRAAAARGRVETYETVDYGLSALLLRAAIAAGNRPRFVYLSAIGAREGTRNAYLAARAKLEAELRGSGLPFTVARPSFITGPDREQPRPLERGGAALADLLLRAAGRIGARGVADRYRSIRGEALAEALVAAALDPAQENRVLTGEQLHALAERRR
jgi:uncharacterized protein YbjT (DUF2867 family)